MSNTMEKSKKWHLHYGCHRGTLISRDTDCVELDSLEACRGYIKQRERMYARLGYYVWFATAKGPDGEEVTVHPGTPYES